jgi:eukaryotic-like serine/threonine-protein kinase
LIGKELSHYRLEKLLGAGGMGEVYLARDTRLGRMVAVKTLAESARLDPERRARFETEARTVAALSHPNICALYDVGRHEGTDFLVMELVDGETLAARLERGRMEVAEALAVAIQIAEALDAAHRRGIVHRDLKPGNVMLSRSGVSRREAPRVKLLDFGLARLLASETADDEGLDGRTATAPLTRQGQILGTLPYMAPEQLEGKRVDGRTDLFAFGAMLHEMLTGRRAFEGSTQASLIGSILRAVPAPVGEAAPGAPPELEHVIAVCLAKDPEERWSSGHDVLLQLERIAATLHHATSSSTPPLRRRQRIAWSVAAVAVATAIALAVALSTGRQSAPLPGMERTVLSVLPPEGTMLAYGQTPQVSPDGLHVAMVAFDEAGSSQLYVRALGAEAARPLPETQDAHMPFWSPDGRMLGFFAEGHLKTVSLSGGSPRILARAPVPRGGTWSDEGLILFVGMPRWPPSLLPAAGGDAVAVPIPEGEMSGRLFPAFLPDGRHYLYLSLTDRHGAYSLRVAALDSPDSEELVRTTASGAFVPPGHLLFRRETTLLAQPFDPRTRRLGGSPVPIAEGVGKHAITHQGLFSVSGNGVLTFQSSTPGTEIVWFDRDGRRLGTAVGAGDYNSPCLMPDGTTVVYDAADPVSGTVDIWALDSVTGLSSRLTYSPAADFYPVCSPHGGEVLFASLRDGPPNLYRVTLDAPGSERAVLQQPFAALPTDWSADGMVIYSALRPDASWDIELLDLASGRSEPLVATAADEGSGRLSPDGRWIAYTSDETGRREVYVQTFPGGAGKWQVSRAGGLGPQWRGDGGEIFFLAPDRRLIAVETSIRGNTFALGESRALFETPIAGREGGIYSSAFAASADGQRFLVTSATDARPITVVLNWTMALED